MKRSRQTIVLIMISFVMIIVSFFVPSQLDAGMNYVYVMGFFLILLSLIASLYAYKEKSAKGPRTRYSPWSARTFCGFNAFITIVWLLVLFNPTGVNTLNIEGGPLPVNQNETFIILWIMSSILLIIAALIYEDQNIKHII